MKKELEKVYIKKPENITDKELRVIFKTMRVKAKITKDQVQVHVTNWNDNGVFCLGMKFQQLLAAHYLQLQGKISRY